MKKINNYQAKDYYLRNKTGAHAKDDQNINKKRITFIQGALDKTNEESLRFNLSNSVVNSNSEARKQHKYYLEQTDQQDDLKALLFAEELDKKLLELLTKAQIAFEVAEKNNNQQSIFELEQVIGRVADLYQQRPIYSHAFKNAHDFLTQQKHRKPYQDTLTAIETLANHIQENKSNDMRTVGIALMVIGCIAAVAFILIAMAPIGGAFAVTLASFSLPIIIGASVGAVIASIGAAMRFGSKDYTTEINLKNLGDIMATLPKSTPYSEKSTKELTIEQEIEELIKKLFFFSSSILQSYTILQPYYIHHLEIQYKRSNDEAYKKDIYQRLKQLETKTQAEKADVGVILYEMGQICELPVFEIELSSSKPGRLGNLIHQENFDNQWHPSFSNMSATQSHSIFQIEDRKLTDKGIERKRKVVAEYIAAADLFLTLRKQKKRLANSSVKNKEKLISINEPLPTVPGSKNEYEYIEPEMEGEHYIKTVRQFVLINTAKPYELLNLAKNATQEELKQAYQSITSSTDYTNNALHLKTFQEQVSIATGLIRNIVTSAKLPDEFGSNFIQRMYFTLQNHPEVIRTQAASIKLTALMKEINNIVSALNEQVEQPIDIKKLANLCGVLTIDIPFVSENKTNLQWEKSPDEWHTSEPATFVEFVSNDKNNKPQGDVIIFSLDPYAALGVYPHCGAKQLQTAYIASKFNHAIENLSADIRHIIDANFDNPLEKMALENIFIAGLKQKINHNNPVLYQNTWSATELLTMESNLIVIKNRFKQWIKSSKTIYEPYTDVPQRPITRVDLRALADQCGVLAFKISDSKTTNDKKYTIDETVFIEINHANARWVIAPYEALGLKEDCTEEDMLKAYQALKEKNKVSGLGFFGKDTEFEPEKSEKHSRTTYKK